MSKKLPGPLADLVLELGMKAFPGGGRYVEAGAPDGGSHRNTLSLNENQWSGLLIEPDPISFEGL